MRYSRGDVLRNFTILELIGQGGMGEVYRAKDTKLNRHVALKVLPLKFDSESEFFKRFVREARLLASLNHPYIAALYDFQEVEGYWFLVMELVEGETLSERLRRGPMSLAALLPTFGRIAAALSNAHARGVVHRDLKPGNLKFDRDDTIKLIDFGIARSILPTTANADEHQTEVTQMGGVIGTPAYMSPEQACGSNVDQRTDIWSFGCCLFEALTGERLFSANNSVELFAKVVKDEPDWNRIPQSTPPLLRELIIRCVKIDPEKRIAEAGRVRDIIEVIQRETEQISTPSPLVTPRPSRYRALVAVDPGRALARDEDGEDGKTRGDCPNSASLIEATRERYQGTVLASAEQRHLLAFETPSNAVLFGLTLQSKLRSPEIPKENGPRMAIHTGELQGEAGDAEEIDLSRPRGAVQETLCLLDLAEPMQILMSESSCQTARSRFQGTRVADQATWLDHGRFDFAHLNRSWQIYEVGLVGVSNLKPPAGSNDIRPCSARRRPALKPLLRHRS